MHNRMAHHVQVGRGLHAHWPDTFRNIALQRKPLVVERRKVTVRAEQDSSSHASRRDVLTLLVSLTAGSASDAKAADGEPAPAVAFPVSTPAPEPQPNDPTIFGYDFASDIPCNLRVREYWMIINQQRPRTWQQIAQQIQTGSYEMLSKDLNVTPMADLRQAALFLPWALLQNYDYTAAVDSMKAYKNFDEHVKDVQRAASAAAALALAEPSQQQAQQQAQLAQQVQQAFILMSASLDGFLATIPVKYTVSLGLFQQPGRLAPAPAAPPPPAPEAPAAAESTPTQAGSPPAGQ